MSQTTYVLNAGKFSSRPWRGDISAKDFFIDIQPMLNDLGGCLQPVNQRAKMRCVDGRRDAQLDPSVLGAQIPGGIFGAALALRLAQATTTGNFVTDSEAMIDACLRLGIQPGGHTDNIHAEGAVGCGAIDRMADIVASITDENLANDSENLAKVLIGQKFDEAEYGQILAEASVVQSTSAEYFDNRSQVINILGAKVPGSAAELEGPHQEALVVVNYCHGETLDSNSFASKYGRQAFGFDAWYAFELAEALFPLPDQSQLRDTFALSLVVIAVATLMTLTDGSLQLLVCRC